jgi:hypothetical protein
MSVTGKPGRSQGKVAMVEIAATDDHPAIMAVEVSLGRQKLTISDQHETIDTITRDLARRLIDHVRKEHGNRT